ncbi:hypothetical protein CGI97_23840 [Vibrio parahaemolyticus]|uniref:glycosyltransferase n=3 Tax=Vibrio parahaemolyticus TaxID=670 RepID=UPI00111CF5C6|nr:glycosyltransferase [Vibrio parahaemolyticus]TOG57355.1 hypothetical protein CGI97_23840 [Vibrio parahaemolyticus]
MSKSDIAFVHDHNFDMYQGNYYTTGSLTKDLWSRYRREHLHGHIHIIARGKHVNFQPNTSSISNCEFTKFKIYENYVNPIKILLDTKKIKSDIKSYIEKNNIRHLIIRLPSELGLIAISVAKELGIRYAVEVVACTWDSYWYHGDVKAKIYSPIITKRVKHTILNAPYAIYVTDKILQQRYPCRGKTASASNVKLDDNSPSVSEHIKSSKVNNRLNLTLIGTMKTNVKGIDIALKAIRYLLNNTDTEFTLTIIGSGDPSRYVRQAETLQLQGSVNFVGFLSKNDVYKTLKNTDIYIQPSFQEGLPRATIEAMSFGLPVASSSAGGLPELIDHKFIHTPGDYKKLATDIIELSRYENRRKYGLMNLNRSQDFLPAILETKRKSFWDSFFR